MNKEIKEMLDKYEEGDEYEKYLIKQICDNEIISNFDIKDWEKETGRKSTW